MLCFKSNSTFFTSKRKKIYFFSKWLTSGNNLADQRKRQPHVELNLHREAKPCRLRGGIFSTALVVTAPSSPATEFGLSSQIKLQTKLLLLLRYIEVGELVCFSSSTEI